MNHTAVPDEHARLLSPDFALVHVRSALDVPAGPLAGHHDALFSALLIREMKKWVIDSFHNTLAPAKAALNQRKESA